MLETTLDDTIVVAKESLKVVVDEVWSLGARITNAVAVGSTLVLGKAGLRLHMSQRSRLRPHDGASLDSSAAVPVDGGDPSGVFAEPAPMDAAAAEAGDDDGHDDGHMAGANPFSQLWQADVPDTLRRSAEALPTGLSARSCTGVDGPNDTASQERVFRSERELSAHMAQTTGLLEDIRLWLLLLIEGFADALQSFVRTIFAFFRLLFTGHILKIIDPRTWWRTLRAGGAKFHDAFRRPDNASALDLRDKEDIITQAGYPYERYSVITADGYRLRLDRIPRPKASKVAFFQHGVLDNSFAWVSTGVRSLAFQYYDAGYDVWLGNFRGTSLSRTNLHCDAGISSSAFWNFSLNEHAWQDFPAFLRRIHAVKLAELPPETPLFTTAITHSMGACACLMYLVRCGMIEQGRAPPLPEPNTFGLRTMAGSSGFYDHPDDGEPDADNVAPIPLRSVTLLSPAGVHAHVPFIVYILGPLLSALLRFLPIHVFRFPSVTVRNAVAKLLHDVRSSPSTKYVVALIVSHVIGGEAEDHPVHRVPNLPQNLGGISAGIFRHFYQLWCNQRFEAYDYRSTLENEEAYGSPLPINFLDNYDVISQPVHFVAGVKDRLIPPENILIHYQALAEHRPDLAHIHAFADSGHLEFTIGLTDLLSSEIMGISEYDAGCYFDAHHGATIDGSSLGSPFADDDDPSDEVWQASPPRSSSNAQGRLSPWTGGGVPAVPDASGAHLVHTPASLRTAWTPSPSSRGRALRSPDSWLRPSLGEDDEEDVDGEDGVFPARHALHSRWSPLVVPSARPSVAEDGAEVPSSSTLARALVFGANESLGHAPASAGLEGEEIGDADGPVCIAEEEEEEDGSRCNSDDDGATEEDTPESPTTSDQDRSIGSPASQALLDPHTTVGRTTVERDV